METELADAHSALTDEHGIGWQTVEQWQALADTLLRYGALAKSVNVEEAITNQFLDE